MGYDPSIIIPVLLVTIIPVILSCFVLYFIIRFGVKHGMQAARAEEIRSRSAQGLR